MPDEQDRPQDHPQDHPPVYPSDEDVDEVVAEFSGDLRAAIRALLADIATLAADADAVVSFGYVRGFTFSSGAKRRP